MLLQAQLVFFSLKLRMQNSGKKTTEIVGHRDIDTMHRCIKSLQPTL